MANKLKFHLDESVSKRMRGVDVTTLTDGHIFFDTIADFRITVDAPM